MAQAVNGHTMPVKTPTSPIRTKSQRKRAEAAVERLLAVAERLIAEIDAIEGDADLEDEEADGPGGEDDEAWLSVPEGTNQDYTWRVAGTWEVRVAAEEGREAQVDDEPIDDDELGDDVLDLGEFDDTGDDCGTPWKPKTDRDLAALDAAMRFVDGRTRIPTRMHPDGYEVGFCKRLNRWLPAVT